MCIGDCMTLASPLDWFFYIVTQLGSELFYIVFLTFVYWVVDKDLGRRLLIVLLPSIWLNSFLKDTFKMPRPPPEQQLVPETGYGFPSGHAQGSTVLWGFLSTQVRKNWFYIVSIILIALISFSRIYLAVHYVHDVVGGLIIGVVYLVLFIKLEPYIKPVFQRFTLPQRLVAEGLIPLLFLAIPYLLFADPSTSGYVAPLGALSGALIGIEFEANHIGFVANKGTVIKRIARFIIGLPILFVILFALSMLGSYFLVAYVKYFILGLFVSFFGPLLFKTLKL